MPPFSCASYGEQNSLLKRFSLAHVLRDRNFGDFVRWQ